MIFIRRIVILFCVVVLSSFAVAGAGDGEQAYQKAKASYRKLLDSHKKQMYRENWERVLNSFLAVTESYPSHKRAPSCLYMAGKTAEGLYRISRGKSDAKMAVDYYVKVADRYPSSSLGDDALLLAAQVEEKVFGASSKVWRLYNRILTDYPSGDQKAKAAREAKRLSRYAVFEKKTPPASKKTVRSAGELTGVRYWSNPGTTRVVLDMSSKAGYASNLLPGDPAKGVAPRLYVDVKGAASAQALGSVVDINDGLMKQVRVGQFSRDTVRVVMDLQSVSGYKVFALESPFRIVIDVTGDRSPAITRNAPKLHAPSGSADSITSLLEDVPEPPPLKVKLPSTTSPPGLRRIVVDAGHGGKDPGAIGPSGLQEKKVVLAIAKEVAQRLRKELGCEVILTRDRDVYLPLESRTAIANKVGADLFVSIHANASRSRSARGVETYYLNFSKNDKAMAVAARENNTTLKQVGDLEMILFDLMANAKINESSRLAAEIQKSLVSDLGRSYKNVRDLGVRQGPFYVLLGATMPSVLVETAFISNKVEESRLKSRKFQQKSAAAIVKGIRNYAKALKLIAAQ